jgi:type III restriction enzyme
MLTEGWDANTVTHILGLRAFGTRLISEQVIGRALRRLSYDLDPATGLFPVEYADIMGIDGLNFATQAVPSAPTRPRETVHVHAVPGREALEITFPRVEGYRLELPDERLTADLTQLEPYVLDPAKVGATRIEMAGIIGESETLTLEHLDRMRRSTLVFRLATHLLNHTLRDANERPKLHLFPQAQAIVGKWLDSGLLVCKGGTFPAQLTYRQLADEVCDLLVGAINTGSTGAGIVRALLDPYDPEGSTASVNFTTAQTDRWQPRPDRSQLNWIILDGSWEAQLAQAIENHPRVAAYAKNHNLGLEIPYLRDGQPHRYRPDYLVRLEDGPTLILEVKGERDHADALKAAAIRDKWIPAVNRLARFGTWAFAEHRDPNTMAEELDRLITQTLSHHPA